MSKFKAANAEESRKLREEAAEALETTTEKQPRVRVQDGMNVFWVLPRVGGMPDPYVHKLVHYYPFHACGRKDPVPDPENPGELKEDKFFSNCYRCETAWKTWEAIGKPAFGSEGYSKRSSDMDNKQVAFQAINLSPFFKTDSKGKYAIPDADLLETWGEAYVEVMKGGEVPEDMPEEIAEAAQAGVDTVLVSTELGGDIEDAHYKYVERNEEDPFMSPDKVLLQIVRANGSKSFTNSVTGQKRYTKTHTVDFTLEKHMKKFSLPDGLFDVVEEQARDLSNITCESDELADRMRALVKPTNEEIKDYLSLTGHSFTLDGEEVELDDEDAEDFARADDSDEPVMDQESKNKLADLRGQMKG